MGPFERNLFGRTDGRTDVRTYECKSIVPPEFLGRSKNGRKYSISKSQFSNEKQRQMGRFHFDLMHVKA